MKSTCLWCILLFLMVSCTSENPKVKLETDLGEIVVELYPKKAPLTTANFLSYIN